MLGSRVVSCAWEVVVAFMSCVELVTPVDGVTAVWVTVVVLVRDVCAAAGDGVTTVWVTVDVLVGDICVAATSDGVTAVWVTVDVLPCWWATIMCRYCRGGHRHVRDRLRCG